MISGQKKCRKYSSGSSSTLFYFVSFISLIVPFPDTNFLTLFHLIRLRSHQGIQHQGIIKLILERDNGTALKDQSLTFPAVRYIRKLVWGNVELPCKDLSVTRCLIEHQNKVRVFKDVLNLPAG